MKTKKKFGKKTIVNILKYGFLSVSAFVSIFPFYWMIVSATNSTSDIIKGKLTPGSELFNNITLLFTMADIKLVFINTAKITIIATIASLIVTALAGYGFAKFKSSGKEFVFKILLFSMMIPFAAMMIPLFQLVAKIGLMDSHIAIILPACASVFLIFFFAQNFRSYPTEIIEAARTDGAKEVTIFFRIVAPSMKSTFAAAAIWAFMNQWNNYMWPLIVLQSPEKKTLTLAISSLSSAYFVEYGAIMVALVIATLPVIVVFLTMQKQFVSGILGSSK